MKRLRITALVLCLSFFLLPALLLIVGVVIEDQFDETYYGEYKEMVYRLRETEGKKIVVIGNSAVPFGVNSDLLTECLPDYQAVNFGLYGSIGTKAMMNAARAEIKEGDVVILLPELNERSLSLAFSGEQFLYAVDGDFSLLFGQDDWESLVFGYPRFLSEKLKRLYSDKMVDEVYAKRSFLSSDGSYQDYVTLDRPYNVMPTGWDENDEIAFSALLSEEFLTYVKEYQSFVEEKGASFFFGFAPVNRLARGIASLDPLYQTLRSYGISVLGTPDFSVMDHEWFFDSNYHLNTAGSSVFTTLLAEQIMAELGKDAPITIELPEKPSMPVSLPKEGNDEQAGLFLYEENGDSVRIVGLTEEGKEKNELIVPSQYHGKKVVAFEREVFQNMKNLSKITLGANISVLYDGSFNGCTHLIALVLVQTDPNSIAVGKNLLKGANDCKIYVSAEAEQLFSTHYFWQTYQSNIRSYS